MSMGRERPTRVVRVGFPTCGFGSVACLALLALLGTTALATPCDCSAGQQRFVRPDGLGADGCHSAASPCGTIAHALRVAEACDQVHVYGCEDWTSLV